MNKIYQGLLTCDKCATTTCENLAKTVAKAWLKKKGIPIVKSDPSPPTSKTGCSNPASSLDAAHKAAFYIDYYGGVNIRDEPWYGPLFGSSNNKSLQAIISSYQTCIKTIREGLSCADHRKCVTKSCEQCAQDVAKKWLASHPYEASGGTKGGAPAKPKATGVDADCENFGGEWLGGALDWICINGKGASKGAKDAFQNPLNQYLPLMMLGFGMVAVIIILRK